MLHSRLFENFVYLLIMDGPTNWRKGFWQQLLQNIAAGETQAFAWVSFTNLPSWAKKAEGEKITNKAIIQFMGEVRNGQCWSWMSGGRDLSRVIPIGQNSQWYSRSIAPSPVWCMLCENQGFMQDESVSCTALGKVLFKYSVGCFGTSQLGTRDSFPKCPNSSAWLVFER